MSINPRLPGIATPGEDGNHEQQLGLHDYWASFHIHSLVFLLFSCASVVDNTLARVTHVLVPFLNELAVFACFGWGVLLN